MKRSTPLSITVFIAVVFLCTGAAPEKDASRKGQKSDDWTIAEYSGSRSEKDIRTALASKGFAWLSGSPADNEKLSIGKNAQFFGFVALRYESGRAANRGVLGRAFYNIANPEQKKLMVQAVLDEDRTLKDWWESRKVLLHLFENHLYTGESINEEEAIAAGTNFSKLNAIVAIHEARAYAALEDSLIDKQRKLLKSWREDPELANELGRDSRLTADELKREQFKQLEDLYAKAFSWITGTSRDNEIIPLGQPAQFFGFVSIRHKSGHGASRGKIAKSFFEILNRKQEVALDQAIKEQMPVVQAFLERRHEFLEMLALLRTDPEAFDEERAMELAAAMGGLEAQAGWIEAKTYRKIRQTMSNEQTDRMMELRSQYIIDKEQVESLTFDERGSQLAMLCAGCHGTPDQYRPGMIGPSLKNIFDRPIASANGFEYSEALEKLKSKDPWTSEAMDAFLAAPKIFAPGTKMEFQGLLNPEDRKALIEYLRKKWQ